MLCDMRDITRILSQIENGDPSAADQLLPLVYQELRRLAAAKMAHESPDHTLEATGLVHEAYLRLVDADQAQHWDSRGHFFAAAAEAMRRILVDYARRKQSNKRGGQIQHVELDSQLLGEEQDVERVLDVSASLDRLAAEDPQAAELVKLRFFAGFSLPEAAKLLGIPRSTAYDQWTYAQAWLRCDIQSPGR
jgi:RNA polymerase sigma factor (TIGR02999 family)